MRKRRVAQEISGMTRAVGYIRVSTEKQADYGVSLEVQQNKLEQYAKLYDIELVEVIVDAGASAKTLKRPGLQRALDMLNTRQANAIIVTKLDRLTRRVRDMGTLIEKYFEKGEYTLLSVSDSIDTRTAAGRLVLNVLMSVAQWEREIIVERTTETMAHQRSMGRRTSCYAPYGYSIGSDGKLLVTDTQEQTMIDMIRDARERGLSQRCIVVELTKYGYTTRKGTPLALKQIQRIMEYANIE